MTTASVIIAAFAVIGLVATSVTSAVMIFRALQEVGRLTVTITNLYARQQQELLDRFQAIRWEDLATLRSVQDSEDEEGGFFEPADELIGSINSNGQVYVEPEEEYTEVIEPGWGSLSEANRRARLIEQEQALLDEDFPDEVADANR